jgi:hypothetical protein
MRGVQTPKSSFWDIPERESLYNNTVFEPNGTRETIPLKMFCLPAEDEGSLEAPDPEEKY